MNDQPYTEVQSRIYSHLVLFALVVYDHLITLHREIHSVWLQKRAKGSIIFVINRYALLSLVVGLLVKDHSPAGPQSCEIHQRLYDVSVLLLCLCTCPWRASVVCNRSNPIFAIVFSLVGTAFVAYWVLFLTSERTHVYIVETHQIWCQDVTRLSPASQRIIYIVSRTCVIAGDTLVVLLIWVKTYRSSKELHRTNQRGHTVNEYLMLDGTLYFMALLALNLAMLLVKNTTLITSILHALTGLLVSRFLLDLRETLIRGADGVGDISQATTSSQISLGQENEQILREA